MERARVAVTACNLAGWLLGAVGLAVAASFFVAPAATAHRLQAWHASGVLYAVPVAVAVVALAVAVAIRERVHSHRLTASVSWLVVACLATVGVMAAASGVDPWRSEATQPCAPETTTRHEDPSFTLEASEPLARLTEGREYQQGPSIRGLAANTTLVTWTAQWPDDGPDLMEWRPTIFHANGSTMLAPFSAARGAPVMWNMSDYDARLLALEVRPSDHLEEPLEVTLRIRVESASGCA